MKSLLDANGLGLQMEVKGGASSGRGCTCRQGRIMSQHIVDAILLLPFAVAIPVMIWILWNLSKELRR